MKVEVNLWLFPVIFMVHEMEEIVGFRVWFEKNLDLIEKYSILRKLYRNFSTEGFAVAVLEEYVICIVVTYVATIWKMYLVWIGVFIAFLIHLLIHIAQSIIVRKYIPSLISSIVLFPGSVYLVYSSVEYLGLTFESIVAASILCVILMFLNLIFVHWIMGLVTRKIAENEMKKM